MDISDIAIKTEHLTKCYRIIHDRPERLKDLAISALTFRKLSSEQLLALDDVSLEIGQGEAVGIVGPNGSGKTTLLGVIARVIKPTAGEVYVAGRVAVLLEVGAGFHPDLTAVENIYLNGAIIGLPRAEIDVVRDQILDFAELHPFKDMAVRTYSAGMRLRLGFAVATHLEPDILLIDEALAVGDEHFQHKCYDWMAQLRHQGTTIGLVSHDLEAIRRLCHRCIWLQDGQVYQDGPTPQVLAAYRQSATYQQPPTDTSQPTVPPSSP